MTQDVNPEIVGLLRDISARVTLLMPPSSGTYWAMATLIGPSHAVMPIYALPQWPSNRKEDQLLRLSFTHYDPPWQDITARVMGVYDQLDVALLELSSPAAIRSFQQATIPVSMESRWYSLFITPGSTDGEIVSGRVISGSDFLEHPALLLEADSVVTDWHGAAGAPVLIDGKLYGVMVGADEGSRRFFAYPLPSLEKLIDGDVLVDTAGGQVVSDNPGTEEGTGNYPEFRALFNSTNASSARRAIEAAEEFRQRFGDRAVSTDALIAGIYRVKNSPLRKVLDNLRVSHEQFIHTLIEATSHEGWREVNWSSNVQSPILTALPPVSNNVHYSLNEVGTWKTKLGAKELKAHHLLLGVLSTNTSPMVKVLEEMGVTIDRVLNVLKTSLRNTGTPTLTNLNPDDASNRDLLGVKREVDALAKVIASTDLKPPLSIGLLGDWGTGKSTFMKLMEDSIKERMTDAEPGSDGKRVYCENVVQIWFNAWHYIDTDIWASLTSEIFKELARKLEDEASANPALARERLLAATRGASDVLAEAERKKSEAEADLCESSERLQRLLEREDTIEVGLKEIAREAYRVVAEEPEVKMSIAHAAKELNIPSTKRAATDLKAQLLELRESGGTIKAMWLAIRNAHRRKVIITLLIALAVCALVAIAAITLLPDILGWLKGTVILVSSLAASALTFVAPFIGVAKRAVGFIKKINDSTEKLFEKAKEEKKQALELEREKIKEKVQLAEEHIKQARGQLDEYRRKLEELRADRKMADFVRQRNQSSDYTKHLGVIASARNDFERLSDLLEEVRKQKETSGDEKEIILPHIDRIVLYIDDLDRCPEKEVVKVLQAVHLLLAFKLFVVVVGVDSRWLLHSLRVHMRALDNGTEVDEEGTENGDEWRSTPLNYLEKIFQIPFTLRPMRVAGFEELIEAMAGAKREGAVVNASGETKQSEGSKSEKGAISTAVSDGSTEQKKSEGMNDDESKERGTNGSDASSTSQKDVTSDGTNDGSNDDVSSKASPISDAAQLEITEWEKNVMKRLRPLFPSPRAAKRFVNIYRLMRASLYTDQRGTFVGDANGGEHRAALLLLAIMIGQPDEADRLLRVLVEERPDDAWWSLIDNFLTRPGIAPAALEKDEEREQWEEAVERWKDLTAKLASTRDLIPDDQRCDDFIKWAPEVARYSFKSGKLLFAAVEEEEG